MLCIHWIYVQISNFFFNFPLFCIYILIQVLLNRKKFVINHNTCMLIIWRNCLFTYCGVPLIYYKCAYFEHDMCMYILTDLFKHDICKLYHSTCVTFSLIYQCPIKCFFSISDNVKLICYNSSSPHDTRFCYAICFLHCSTLYKLS